MRKFIIFLSLFLVAGGALMAQSETERSRSKPLFKDKGVKFAFVKDTNSAYYRSDILSQEKSTYLQQDRRPLEVYIDDEPGSPPKLSIVIFNQNNYFFNMNKITFYAWEDTKGARVKKVFELPKGVQGILDRGRSGVRYIEIWTGMYTGEDAREMAELLIELADRGSIKIEGQTDFYKTISLSDKGDRDAIRAMGDAWLKFFDVASSR